MLIASAPSASATLIAARTISSRDSAAARRGTCRPPRFISSSTCRRRRAERRSSVRKARNGAQSSSSSAATVTPSWPGRPSGVPTLANLSEFGAAACLSYIVLLPYFARHSTSYDNSEEGRHGGDPRHRDGAADQELRTDPGAVGPGPHGAARRHSRAARAERGRADH